MLRACVTITIFIGLLVSSVSVAKAQQAPKQTKPLRDGYVPDLAKPDRENKDVQANAQYLADREKIRNTVLSYSHLFDERNFDEWKKLWTDDVVLEIVMPGVGTVRTHGLDTFWDLVAFLVTNGGSSYGWEAGTPIARG